MKSSRIRTSFSPSNHWRNSYNYREKYLVSNPGLLGCIWFCSQCGKPLWGKNSLQVDHIVPPSVFAHKKRKNGKIISNTSILARALNSNFNLVAICPSCNLSKSDKMGIPTVKGVAAKIGEISLGLTQKGIATAIFGCIKLVISGIKLLKVPLSKNSPTPVKIAFIILYMVIIYSVFF